VTIEIGYNRFAGHDALDFSIDLQEPLVSAHAQDHSDGDRIGRTNGPVSKATPPEG